MIEQAGLPLLYIDTNVFIDFLQGAPERVALLESMFDRLERSPDAAITSELTLAEVLGKKAPSVEWEDQRRFYGGLFLLKRFVGLRAVSREILLETAEFRRSASVVGRQVKLADAIHAVTASKAGCRYFLTSDKRITVLAPLEKIPPDAAGIGAIEAALDA